MHSKWECSDSLPDLSLIPKICEIFGISSDSLLGISASFGMNEAKKALFNNAREFGEFSTSYEAVKATSYLAERENGMVKMAHDGIKIQSAGIAVIINGAETLERVRNIDLECARSMTELITDVNVMTVFKTLGFGRYLSEKEICELSGVAAKEAETALLKLLKYGICEYTSDGKYVLGARSYTLFAVLVGSYIASPEGFENIGSITCGYTTEG